MASWNLRGSPVAWLACTVITSATRAVAQTRGGPFDALAPGAALPSLPLGAGIGLVGPDVRLVWNSHLPYSLNDGPLWAGRGLNASVTVGLAAAYRAGRAGLDVAIAPTFLYSQNRAFDMSPGTDPGRSLYASPWHATGASADLPLRFGDRPIRRIDPGESRLEVRFDNVAAGVSNAGQWWGPGKRNALVLSNNAPGIPRAFVRTARPVKTPIGDFTGEFVAGTLTKSLFFDTLAANDYRSFSGFVVSYRQNADSGLIIGLARAVYAPEARAFPSAGAALNAFRWRPHAGADSAEADQISSVFARWRFPESGFQMYAEWARMMMPRSFSEFLETPYDTQGYTLGIEWALPRGVDHAFRLQSEVSYLEQSVVNSDRPPVDFYTGRSAPQGYTQRGQVMGAAIGPGGSSQWVALDYLTPGSSVGAFVGRIRWENDAMYRQQYSTFFAHDVSVLSGVRGGMRLSGAELSSELTVARRFNYLFQNGWSNPGGAGTVRVWNVSLATRFTRR